jgi:hypothetical protein
VKPEKTRTPMTEIAKSRAAEPRNRLTIEAMMTPIRPITRKLPQPDRLRFVV